MPVFVTWLGLAYGYCYEDGQIQIPAVSIRRIGEAFGHDRCGLRDILRHELGHALAHVHPETVDTPAFVHAFGGGYDDEWDDRPGFDRRLFVSEYATSSPCEDFAETVMVYARHRGRLHRYAGRPGVACAFRFVRSLAADLRRRGLQWRRPR